MARMNWNHLISSSVLLMGPGPTDPGPSSNNSSRFVAFFWSTLYTVCIRMNSWPWHLLYRFSCIIQFCCISAPMTAVRPWRTGCLMVHVGAFCCEWNIFRKAARQHWHQPHPLARTKAMSVTENLSRQFALISSWWEVLFNGAHQGLNTQNHLFKALVTWTPTQT